MYEQKDYYTMNNFFIIGVDRSGTSLLSLILDAHSKIWIPNESHFFIKYYKKYNNSELFSSYTFRNELLKNILNEKYLKNWEIKIKASEINIEKCNSLSSCINEIYSTMARKANKSIWADKTPEYITHIDILNDLFPHSKYIHIIRDGRDVARSIVEQKWGANDFQSALRSWSSRMQIGHKMLSMLPKNNYKIIKYEDLITDPEAEIRRTLEFLNLDFEESILVDYRKHATSKVGDALHKHHKNLSRSIDRRNAFKWKHSLSKADQALAYEIAGSQLVEFGYETGVKKNILKNFKKMYYRIIESYMWRIGHRW